MNCNGDTGMFRTNGVDLSLKEKKFDNRITDQLLKATRSLSGWYQGIEVDYYQFLTFKIVDGKLTDILP